MYMYDRVMRCIGLTGTRFVSAMLKKSVDVWAYYADRVMRCLGVWAYCDEYHSFCLSS